MLKDLIVGADADARQFLGGVVPVCLEDGGLENIVDRAQGDRVVEKIAEQFDDPAEGTMTDQHQAEDELPQPGLSHRQIKEHRVLRACVRRKGLVKRLLGGSGLLVDKLATDLVIQGELGDGIRPGQSLNGQVLALLGAQRMGGTAADNLLLRGGAAVVRMDAHVCFLREMGGWSQTTSLGETDNLENLNPPNAGCQFVTWI